MLTMSLVLLMAQKKKIFNAAEKKNHLRASSNTYCNVAGPTVIHTYSLSHSQPIS